LAGIAIRLVGTGVDKSPRLLLRFAITWIPLLFISLPALELGQGEQPLFVTLLRWIALLWYIALLIGLIATHGKGGIQDAICKSESVLHITEALSGGRKAALWICAVVLLIIEIGTPMFPPDDEPLNGESPNVTVPQGAGLPFESLRLTAHTVHGYWKELDPLIDDEASWNGSAAVISRDKDKIYLASNSHVLGLRDLANSDDASNMIPEINKYNLWVEFASRKKVPVLRFADQAGGLDLAILEVNSAGLVEGRDYVIVPYDKSLLVKVGEDAVAVGSPHGLAGTHTYGKISAIRDLNHGQAFRAIQTDAAINPGNSGGPLFVKKGKSYIWAGVNTFFASSDNLGFAIHASHVWDSEYHWFPVSPRGAANAIKTLYGRDAVVK